MCASATHPVTNAASMAATAATLGQKLMDAGWMMVTAESCTGGMIASTVTEIAGSSAWFERAYVTYSNEAKSTAIGVSGDLIAQHGAVSEPVAKAMAEGALAASVADVSVAVTGIAGPGGGSEAKPVGTVCFAWSTHSSATVIHTCHFHGDRAEIRRQATQYAMAGLNDVLDAAKTQGPLSATKIS